MRRQGWFQFQFDLSFLTAVRLAQEAKTVKNAMLDTNIRILAIYNEIRRTWMVFSMVALPTGKYGRQSRKLNFLHQRERKSDANENWRERQSRLF